MITVRDLIELLEDTDQSKEVYFVDLGDYYDTMYIGVSEYGDSVRINIKNVPKQQVNKDYKQ